MSGRRQRRQCRGRTHVGPEDKVLELDFDFDGTDVGEYRLFMALDDEVVTEKDLIAQLGPEAARSAIEDAIQNGIDRPY